MEESLDEQILKLEGKIYKAELERDAWRGKPSEHHKMATIMVESLRRQLSELMAKHKP